MAACSRNAPLEEDPDLGVCELRTSSFTPRLRSLDAAISASSSCPSINILQRQHPAKADALRPGGQRAGARADCAVLLVSRNGLIVKR
jgi:hypothetical protein